MFAASAVMGKYLSSMLSFVFNQMLSGNKTARLIVLLRRIRPLPTLKLKEANFFPAWHSHATFFLRCSVPSCEKNGLNAPSVPTSSTGSSWSRDRTRILPDSPM